MAIVNHKNKSGEKALHVNREIGGIEKESKDTEWNDWDPGKG